MSETIALLQEEVVKREQAEEEVRSLIAKLKQSNDDLASVNRRLQETEMQQKAILDGIPDIAWLKDKESRFIAANRPFGLACDVAPDDLAGKTDLDIWPRELAERYREDDREVMESGQTRRVEEPLRDQHGRQTWIETIKVPVKNGRGEIIGTVGIARDITARKRMEDDLRGSREELEMRIRERTEELERATEGLRAEIAERKRVEEALRDREEQLATILRTAMDGFWVTDREGRFLEANDAICRNLGYSRDELLRMSVSDIEAEEKPEVILQVVQRIIERGSDRFEGLHRRKDGSLRNVEISVNYLPPPHDRFFAFLHDITERKRAEAEKEKLQTQFLQAQKMEAVGRLAGGVAHDFNNLLTVIIGYSELLLQKIGKESPMHGEVKEIHGAGERAATLTRQLLAFSRKQIIEPKVLDLNLLMADLSKMLARLIGENIDLKTVPGKNVGKVKVDPGQFEQVLINLAVNARDAMPDGGSLLIETANVELDEAYCAQRPYEIDPGRYVMLAVSDTGHGMAKETTQQIFEPFFTTKEKGKGTGLGLSMVYGAVKQSGGSIEVYSEVGKGTTFKIYLPRVEGEAVRPVKDDQATALPTGTETVLVTEDEEILRNLCVRILERQGYKVLQARNGTEGVALAQGYGDRIDLLMTDVVMPGMNGAELARQLVLHYPKMKVLFTSGYTDDAISPHGVLDADVSFIGKPYTPLALARKVRKVLDKA